MIPRQTRGGFTLIELMVATAVLAILGVIFATMVSMTSSAIKLSNQSIDSSSQGALVFDRLRADLVSLVKRPDVDFEAQNPASAVGGGNIMLFLSSVASAGTATAAENRNVSLIAYQVALNSDNGGRPCLERAGKPVSWTTTGFMGLNGGLPLSFISSTFPAALLPTATNTLSDFDILAPGVLRMVVGFQLYPDNQAVTLQDGTTPTPAMSMGQVVYSPPIRLITPTGGTTGVPYVDFTRISALVIGLVAINADLAKTATPAALTSISSDFPVPASGSLPLKTWSSVADNLATTGGSSIPLPLRQAVRVFQQSFPVRPYGTAGN